MSESVALHNPLLQSLCVLQDGGFHQLLCQLLNDRQGSIRGLHLFLQQRDIVLSEKSLYRYFDGSRCPNERFLKAFADYVNLSPHGYMALKLAHTMRQSRLI